MWIATKQKCRKRHKNVTVCEYPPDCKHWHSWGRPRCRDPFTNSQNFSGPGREIGRFCVNVCTNVSFKHIDLWRICIGLVIQRELCPYLCQVTVVCHGDSKIQCHTMKAFFVQLSQVRLEITVPVACLKSGPGLHYSLTPAVNRSVRPRVKMFSWLRNR